MAFYSYLSTKIIIAFITKSYQDLFGVRSYINALFLCANVSIGCVMFYIAIDILAHCFYSCRCGSCLLELLHSST